VRTLLAIFDEMDQPVTPSPPSSARGFVPAALEMMDREVIQPWSLSSTSATQDAGAVLLIR